MTWGRYYWPVFLIAASLAFSIPEIIALMTNTSNTLSDYSWGNLDVRQGQTFWQHNVAWILTLGVWIVIAFWLTEHIWFRRFR